MIMVGIMRHQNKKDDNMLRSFFSKFKKNLPRKHLKDPVCGMEATDDVNFDYEGRTYYFCSDHCRAQFEKEPERYISQRQ